MDICFPTLNLLRNVLRDITNKHLSWTKHSYFYQWHKRTIGWCYSCWYFHGKWVNDSLEIEKVHSVKTALLNIAYINYIKLQMYGVEI